MKQPMLHNLNVNDTLHARLGQGLSGHHSSRFYLRMTNLEMSFGLRGQKVGSVVYLVTEDLTSNYKVLHGIKTARVRTR